LTRQASKPGIKFITKKKMKKYLIITTLLLCFASFASAETITLHSSDNLGYCADPKNGLTRYSSGQMGQGFETWAEMRANTTESITTSCDIYQSSISVFRDTYEGDTAYSSLQRAFVCFNTNGIENISSATLSLNGKDKSNALTDDPPGIMPENWGVVATSYTYPDFGSFGNSPFSNVIYYDNFLIDEYNILTLNNDGINYINSSGQTCFGLMDYNYDLLNNDPLSGGVGWANIKIKMGGYVIQNSDPILTIETSPAPTPGIISLPGSATADIVKPIGDLVNDTWAMLVLALGLPLGFFTIKKVIALIVLK
jgi:hypothetical protein